MKIIATAETARGKLHYTLFSHREDDIEQYGITVTSTIFEEESETLKNISSDRYFVQELMFCLAENAVLPSTFKEITEEYITAAMSV